MKIACVGHTGNIFDNTLWAVAVKWLVQNHREYIPNGNIPRFDYIDLNNRRDFLKESKEYDVVSLQYLFRGNNYLGSHNSGELSVSELQSPDNWRKRLKQSKARFIFVFGSHTEVSADYIGDIRGYKRFKLDIGIGGEVYEHHTKTRARKSHQERKAPAKRHIRPRVSVKRQGSLCAQG